MISNRDGGDEGGASRGEQAERPSLEGTGFLRLKDVLQVIPVSPATWWRGVRSGKYPRAYKLGDNATGWAVEDVRALVASIKKQEAA